jgi:predicted transcriptional regulator
MQIMTGKGLVRRDESQRTHCYEAAAGEDQTQRHLVQEMLDRVFDGSSRKLVLHALSAQPATPEEIAEIRSLLDAMEMEMRAGPAAAANPPPRPPSPAS